MKIPPAAEYVAKPPRRIGSVPSCIIPKEKNPFVSLQIVSAGTQPNIRITRDPTIAATKLQKEFFSLSSSEEHEEQQGRLDMPQNHHRNLLFGTRHFIDQDGRPGSGRSNRPTWPIKSTPFSRAEPNSIGSLNWIRKDLLIISGFRCC